MPDLSIFDGDSHYERCGIIVLRPDETTYVIEVPNRYETPADTFAIDVADIRAIPMQDQTHRLMGFVHTHPSHDAPHPSQADIESIPDGYVGLVYHPVSGSIIWYTRNGVIDN